MYSTPTSKSSRVPLGRRSTRSARVSTKRRNQEGGNSAASRIKRSTEQGPARKWIQVMRPPAPHIKFLISKWVPELELTETERKEHEEKLRRKVEQQREKLQEEGVVAQRKEFESEKYSIPMHVDSAQSKDGDSELAAISSDEPQNTRQDVPEAASAPSFVAKMQEKSEPTKEELLLKGVKEMKGGSFPEEESAPAIKKARIESSTEAQGDNNT